MKALKILTKVLLVLLIVYGVVGIFVLPNILKEEITKNAQEVLKRKVSLEEVSVNPFSFEVKLKVFNIHGKGENSSLAGAKEILVNVDPMNFIFGDIQISHVNLLAPFVTLHKDKSGKFNFADLLASDTNASTQEEEKTALPSIVLQKFSIRQGKVHFIDDTRATSFSETLSPINFTLRDFSTGHDSGNSLSLHIEIDDGAYVEYRGKINSVEPLQVEGDIQLHSGRLYTQWKYFQDSLGFIVADGALNASVSYMADFSGDEAKVHINQYELKIDKLRLQDKQTKENVLRMPSFVLAGSADLGKKEVKVDNFSIKDFSIKASRDKNGDINWLSYLPASDEKEVVESNVSEPSPWKIDIAQFKLEMKDSSFEEHYAPKPYTSSFEALSLGLKDIKINAQELSMPFVEFNMSQITTREIDTKAETLFYLESLGIGAEAELKAQDFLISEVKLEGMKVNMLKDKQGRFSYLDYIPYKKKTQEEVKDNSEVKWEVKAFNLKDSSVIFKDDFDAVNGLTHIEKINLNMKDLSSVKGTWSSSKLQMQLNKTAKITVDSKLRQTPLKLNSSFVMKNLDLVRLQPYVNKKVNIDVNSGKLNLDFKLKHDDKRTDLVANVLMNDLNMSERKEGKTFFAFSKLVIKDIGLSLNPDQMKIAKIDIYNSYARMKIDANKTTNLENLMISSGDVNETKTESKPFPVFIAKVNFKDGKGEFSDLSLPLPFKTDIHDLNGQMIALGTLSDIKTTMNINGTVDEYGLMKIKGALLSAAPKTFTDMSVKFQNIDMTNLSPYTGKFIGYELREGKMNVELEYKINDSQMQGGNRIILKKMNLGEEVDSEDAISAPVGLAIALLKDGDGTIDLDVPVEGDVDAPEFAIGHVVWTAFKNLITGVATAPFRFLGNMLGISAEELENIEFEEGKYTLLPPQKETLDKLSTALSEKEMLTLKVAGTYDVKRDLLAMKTALVYDEALQKLEDKTTDISKMDRDKLDDLIEEMYVSHFKQEQLDSVEDKIDEKEISSEDKKLELREQMTKALINDQKVSKEDLINLAQTRAKSIINYLVLKGIAADRLSLESSVEIGIDTEENEYIPTKLELGAK